MPDNDLADMFTAVEQELSGETSVDEAVTVVDVDDGQADDPSLESVEVDIDDEVVGDEVDDNPVEDDDGTVETWNWSDYSDQMVPAIVQGVETLVPLKELRDGYMRQADYTRKTQEVAEYEKAAKWARDVQAGFQQDPMGMLESFAKAYGLLDEQAAGQQNPAAALEDLDEDLRPWAQRTLQAEQELQELKAKMATVENQRIQNEIRAEIDQMKSQYGDSFDPMATLQAAAQKNMSLEDAHWYLMGQKSFAERQQTSQVESVAEQAAKEAAARQSAERAAKKQAASSTSTKAFKATDIPADDFNSIGELFEQIAAGSS